MSFPDDSQYTQSISTCDIDGAPVFFADNDELEYYSDEEIQDFFFPEDDRPEEADMYADGYPDELIPEHAFTGVEEDYYDYAS